MLAVMDEEVVSHPAPRFGHRPHFGHADVRAWWAAMMADPHDIVVSEVRTIDSDRVVVLGEVHSKGKRRIPSWYRSATV